MREKTAKECTWRDQLRSIIAGDKEIEEDLILWCVYGEVLRRYIVTIISSL